MQNFAKKIILFLFALLSFSNYTSAYDGFAKAVILGNFRCGKSVLYNLLTGKEQFENLEHHVKITTSKIECNIDGRSILLYLEDTSGEPKHKELMEKFCEKSHVVFLLLDATEYSKERLKANGLRAYKAIDMVEKKKDEFKELVTKVNEYAPGCELIVIVTKGNLLQGNVSVFELEEIEAFINGLKKLGLNISQKYDLQLENLTDNHALECRDAIQGFIVNALRRYGVNNLPKTPDGFVAKIINKVEDGTCYGKNVKRDEFDLVVFEPDCD